MSREAYSPEGLAPGDWQESTRRHDRVRATWLPSDEDALRALVAEETYAASPRGRLDTLRGAALMLSALAGDVLRGEADEGELCVAEDDVMRAIIARRGRDG